MAAKTSKFKGIFDAAQGPESEETPTPLPGPIAEPEQGPSTALTVLASNAQETTARQRAGRPVNGKKSDPRYQQVTAYVRRDLYRDVAFALHQEARIRDIKRREFSELVDELLDGWWQTHNERLNTRD